MKEYMENLKKMFEHEDAKMVILIIQLLLICALGVDIVNKGAELLEDRHFDELCGDDRSLCTEVEILVCTGMFNNQPHCYPSFTYEPIPAEEGP